MLAAGLALAGAAVAQDSGSMCRSFCDVDAQQCREGEHPAAWAVADALLHLRGSASTTPDKHEQASSDYNRELAAHEHQCGAARQVCRRECAAQAAAPVVPVGPVVPVVPAVPVVPVAASAAH